MEYFYDFNGDLMDRDCFNEHAKCGCVMCGDPILPEMASDMMWVGWKQPLCGFCADQAQFESSLDDLMESYNEY